MVGCGHLVLHVHRHNPLDRACLHQYLGDHALESELWQFGDNLVLVQMYGFQGEGGELCMVYQGSYIKDWKSSIFDIRRLCALFFIGKPLTSKTWPVEGMGDHEIVEIWSVLLPGIGVTD